MRRKRATKSRPSGANAAAPLRQAIEPLAEPLCLCDPEDRIVFANRVFRELNPGAEHLIVPGRRYEEHIRAGLAIGNYPDKTARAEAWLAERMAIRRAGGSFEIRRQDGRWLLVSDERLPGGGLITVCMDITGRKRTEQRVVESEERFRQLTSLSSDWYWEQDADFRFTFMSGEVGDKTGIKVSEHLGRTRWDMPAANLTDDDWRRHRAALERREPFRDFVMRRPDRDGRERWVSVNGDPVLDAAGRFQGYRGTGRDITAQVLLERSLREAQSQFRLILDSVPGAITYVDREERIVSANRTYAEHLERPLEEIVGRTLREAAGDEAYGAGKPYLDRVFAGESVSYERRRKRRDGSVRDLRIQLVPHRDAAGRVVGAFGLFVDVTELMSAQRALENLTENLEERVAGRTAELEAALRELEAFSYSVSHDLRAPLRAIGGFSRMLVEDEGAVLSAEGRRKLAVVEANAVKMGMLVDDLLALARLGRAEMRSERLDMKSLAASAIAGLNPLYPLVRIELGALPQARGDATLVSQLFANLIDNAFKYTSKTAAPRVEIGWSEAGSAYYVRDNGAGFDMAYAGKLFGTFERLHPETEFPGTGIGLATVKRIAERHGGRVWAESAPGAGSTFYFTLPS